MNYDPTQLKLQTTPKEGDRTSARVVSVKRGVLRDFMSPEVIAAWKTSTPDDAAIEILLETSDKYTKRRVLKYPENNQVSPKSNLAKWKKVYGDYPFVGQLVELVADDEGYYQFLF